MKYHTGQNRKEYIELLKDVFRKVAARGDYNWEMVIAINGWGKSRDCGLFDSHCAALRKHPYQVVIVPLGEIITRSLKEPYE
jgi:hypothetical protein